VQDISYAYRSLLKNPGFAAVAVLTLALGIGANIAIFTVVNAVLLQPIPFQEPSRLVRIFDDLNGVGGKDVGMSEPELEDLRERAGVFAQVSAILPVSCALSAGGLTERIESLATNVSYFQILGAKAALGRVYGPEDAARGFTDGVVISDGLWQRQFGGDPHVLGRRIRLDEDGYTIIGVMPPGFQHPGETLSGDVEIWTAGGFSPPNPRSHRFLPGAIGRLKPGLTFQQAQQRLDALASALRATYPKEYPAASRWSLRLEPLQESLTGSVRPTLVVLLAAVGCLLLIVCVNIASLLVARSSSRMRELAIRQALGASRGRLLRQLLTESVLLSFTGGLAAVVVLALTRGSLLAMMPADLPRLSEVHFDAYVVGLGILLSIGTGILCGLTPALHASSMNPNPGLSEGGRSGGPSVRQNRFRALLVATEIASSVVLLIGAGLLVRSFWGALQVNPGLDPKNLMVARIWIPQSSNPESNRYLKAPQFVALVREILRQVRPLPGVQEVAIGGGGSIPFLNDGRRSFAFSLPDEAGSSPGDRSAQLRVVTPDYFKVLKAPLLHGRFFTEDDSEKSKRVAIVNESFARRHLPGHDLIGRRLRGSRLEWEVVGIVGDVRDDGLDEPVAPRMYLSTYQSPGGEVTIYLRGASDTRTLQAAVTRTLRGIDPDLPVYGARTMEELIHASMARRRFSLFLVGGFAGLALFLAAIGIYGVMAFAVNQRTQEFSIRMALGAQQRDIVLLAMRSGMMITLSGVVAGLATALGTTRLMTSLLFGVAPSDPVTFVGVSVVLGIVGLLACWIPAQRAIRVSPVVALRS
jgi:predicted permease